MTSERKTRKPEDPIVTALRNMLKAHEEDERKDLDRRFDLLSETTKRTFEEAAVKLLRPFREEFRQEIREIKERLTKLEKNCFPDE